MNKKVSLIIPVYNEEKNIDSLFNRLRLVLSNLGYDYEVVFINDGSQDNSVGAILKFCQQDNKIKMIEFSRNFGKELAITAGINSCNGDAAIIMDADLQHPPELIPQFIAKWQNGAEVVIGVREKNQREGWVKKLGSYLFYKIIGLIGETKMVPYSTDFRLIDKKVIIEFNRFTEKNRMARGLIAWLGFKRDLVFFEADSRHDGKAGYGFFKLLKLAMSTFVSHSLVPLKLAGYLGIFITLVSAVLSVFMLAKKYIFNDPWKFSFSGPALLAIMILFLIGIVLICLGLMALYIANIHGEVINRPLYVVRERKNFGQDIT